MKTRFSRREIVARAGGAAVLLAPLLRARIANAAPPPTRLVTFYYGDGPSLGIGKVFPGRSGSGWDWSQSPMTASLKAHEGAMSIARGVRLNNNVNALSPHASGALCWVTGATDLAGSHRKDPTGEFYLSQDMSIDHWFAQATGTPKLYLAVGLAMSKPHDYLTISYSGPGQASLPESDPQKAYQALFGMVGGASEPHGRDGAINKRLFVLDLVTQDLKAAAQRFGLSGDERQKMQGYEAALAHIEKGLKTQVTTAAGPTAGSAPMPPQATLSSSVPERVRAMLDITVAALRLGLRRSVAFQLSNPYDGTIDYSRFVPGASTAHHASQHGIGGATGDPAKATVWIYQQLAYLLDQMHAVKEADGTTLLHNSVVYSGTDTPDGRASHDFRNFDHPTFVFGRAGGRLKGNVEASAPAGVGTRDYLDLIATVAEALALGAGVPNPYRQRKGFGSLVTQLLV